MTVHAITDNDTIASIATALGEGGIGIIRISGSRAVQIASQIFIPKSKKVSLALSNRRVIYGHVVDQADEIIDEAICLVMLNPHSYTGEDIIELQCHGGTGVLRAVLRSVLDRGARLSEPGEFTKRAFLNGRLDLTQAESIIEIIRSKSEKGLKQAVKQLEGHFGREVNNIISILTELATALEAAINYPDEVEFAQEMLLIPLQRSFEQARKIFLSSKSGIIYRDGLSVVIVGKPNVGKSSLFNTLLLQERAIVTDIPGTTRDIVEESLTLDGILLKLSDTAGIRETVDSVEKIGVSRAIFALDEAGIIILVLDASRDIEYEDHQILELLKDKQNVICVLNKADLPLRISEDTIKRYLDIDIPVVKISVTSNTGIDDLRSSISSVISRLWAPDDDSMLITSLRQRSLLESASNKLEQLVALSRQGLTIDLIGEEIREVLDIFGKITGQDASDELINNIFSNFCVGK